MSTKVAIVQAPPVLLHRDETIAKVLSSIDEAVHAGAALIVFPEAYVPGYPTWIWRLRPGGDMGLSSEIHARLRENAVDLARGDLQPVQDAAAKSGVTVVLGINERDSAYSGTTLFNSVVVIGPDGTLLNRHRKLMPTNPERMVWGMGDASGLRVVDTPAGRLGCLICWESYMPLARYALYAQDTKSMSLRRGYGRAACHHASHRQAGCWVIARRPLRGQRSTRHFPGREALHAGEWISGMQRPPLGAPPGRSIGRKASSAPTSTRGGAAPGARYMRTLFPPGHLFLLGRPKAAQSGHLLRLNKRTAATVIPALFTPVPAFRGTSRPVDACLDLEPVASASFLSHISC